MKKLLILLCIVLLGGCATTSETIITPTPTPTINPLDLLYEVNHDYVIYTYDENNNWLDTSIQGLPYFNQTDPRWGNELINDRPISITGCIPTNAAMIVNLLGNQDLTPYDLSVLFAEWKDMNVRYDGTMPTAWKKFAREFDLDYVDKLSYEGLEKALRNGWLVVASVTGNPFTRDVVNEDDWASHSILLYGLDKDGYTNVYDPYYTHNNHKFHISEIDEKKIVPRHNLRISQYYAFARK